MSEEFKIEKNVPLPTGTKRHRYGVLREMGIGDSVFFAGMVRNQISMALVSCRPKQFTTRLVDGGVRVWRIA